MSEEEMVGWHHLLDRHAFRQALGVGVGQGNLVCGSPWGRKESDMTEQVNRTELIVLIVRSNSVLENCISLLGLP